MNIFLHIPGRTILLFSSVFIQPVWMLLQNVLSKSTAVAPYKLIFFLVVPQKYKEIIQSKGYRRPTAAIAYFCAHKDTTQMHIPVTFGYLHLYKAIPIYRNKKSPPYGGLFLTMRIGLQKQTL
ncbi:MAG: hypothetical protein ACK5JF_00740 [Oscillospiraceae bacterium]